MAKGEGGDRLRESHFFGNAPPKARQSKVVGAIFQNFIYQFWVILSIGIIPNPAVKDLFDPLACGGRLCPVSLHPIGCGF